MSHSPGAIKDRPTKKQKAQRHHGREPEMYYSRQVVIPHGNGGKRGPRAERVKYNRFNLTDFLNQIAVANATDPTVRPQGGFGRCCNTPQLRAARDEERERRSKVQQALERK